MSSIATYTKDPDATLDYEIDWTKWLNGTTISTSTWTVPTGITKVTDSHTTLVTLIRLSGGTVGVNYSLVNHIVASNGEADDRTIRMKIRQR